MTVVLDSLVFFHFRRFSDSMERNTPVKHELICMLLQPDWEVGMPSLCSWALQQLSIIVLALCGCFLCFARLLSVMVP